MSKTSTLGLGFDMRFFLIFLIGLSAAHAGVAVDSANLFHEEESVTTASFTTTGSATVGASDNFLSVVVEAYVPGQTSAFSSCSWGASSLTLEGHVVATGVDIDIWYLKSPPNGSNTISCTYPASLGGFTAVAFIPMSGVNTTTPFGTVATNTGSGCPISVTATGGTSNDLYLGAAQCNVTSMSSTGTNQTNIVAYGSGSPTLTVAVDTIPGVDTGAFGWSSSGGTNSNSQSIAVAVKGASASSCTHGGWTQSRTIAVPDGSTGSYWGKTSAWVTPDCSSVQYWQPSVGNFGVN